MLIRGVGLSGRTLLEMANAWAVISRTNCAASTTKDRDRFVEKLMRGVLATKHLDMML